MCLNRASFKARLVVAPKYELGIFMTRLYFSLHGEGRDEINDTVGLS